MKVFYKNSIGIVPTKTFEPNCWVHIECPTEEENKFILEDLGVPIEFINDIIDIDERPRIETEDDWTLIVLRVPYRTNDPKLPYSTAPLGLIFKKDCFLSICYVNIDMIEDFSRYSVRKSINFSNYFDLVLRLELSSSVWYLKYLKQINLKIKAAENELERSIKNEDLQTLLELEKCLVYFRTSLKGNDILTNKVKRLNSFKELSDPDLLEDVEIELTQAQDTSKIYSDILSGTMDAYASVISNNLNIIMKRLTSISIILMIPTLIASFYGMNVPNFFENNVFGFFIIFLTSFAFSVVGMIFFKKKRWL